jgi:uncharacterized protein (TIGR00288 family)
MNEPHHNPSHNPNQNRRLNRDQNRVMLLIDADNVSADVITQAFERVMAEQRAIHVRRAYCTAELAAKHLKLFKALSIRPIVNVSTGKNSTDIALAVDAIDLVISERPDVVVLVSSDSDFAPLVIRLREKGCRVEGIGQEGKTADDSKLVYDRFVDIEHRRAGAGTRRAASADEPVRKAMPRGRARAMAVEAVAPVAAPLAATATAPQRPARQPRAPRETAPENVRSRPAVAAPATRTAPQVAQRLSALPDDLARIMSVLPELRSGAPLRLALVAERLRTEGLLSKSAPSTKLFKKFPDSFLLTPVRQPHTVQFLSSSGG